MEIVPPADIDPRIERLVNDLIGRIADKYGRKRSMLISVTMMCAGSLVIACLPTYAAIGAWAPFLLFLLVGETVLVRTEE